MNTLNLLVIGVIFVLSGCTSHTAPSGPVRLPDQTSSQVATQGGVDKTATAQLNRRGKPSSAGALPNSAANAEFEEYRMGHLVRTAGMWKLMLKRGVTEESLLDFDFFFVTKNKTSVEALKSELADYSLQVITEGGIRKTFSISGSTGPMAWTEELLLKWVDYLISVGERTGCKYDGGGASL